MRRTRLADASDLPALIALDPVGPSEPQRAAMIADWVAAGSCHLLEEDGSILGYAVLNRGFFHQPFLEMLMVAASCRGSGVGTALARQCRDLTPAAEKLWTSTNLSNIAMQALLDELGFVLAGRIDHLDAGDPELVYVRLPDTPHA